MTSEKQGELRAFLRSFVAKPGWSVKRLAEESDMHPSSLYNFLDNEKKRLGHSMLNRLAPVMGYKPEELHRMAGLLPDQPKDDPSRTESLRKIEALFNMLDKEELEEAIALMETFAENRRKARKAAAQRGLKHS